MEWRMERQAPFLKGVLQEADQHKRLELLRMANADEINAISELVMNTLRGTVPRSRHTITLLVQAWLTQFVKTAQGVKQSASPGGPSRPGRKPLVPPKPSFTPSAKKETQVHARGEQRRVGSRVAFFRGAWNRTLGYTQ